MRENEISYLIRGAIFNVANFLGPGLLETVYVNALVYELQKKGLSTKTEVGIPLIYKGVPLEVGFRADIIVEDLELIEVKAIESIIAVHHKQVVTYLKLSGLKLGILVNFNSANIADSIIRKVNALNN
jgi:GxxExxY protein